MVAATEEISTGIPVSGAKEPRWFPSAFTILGALIAITAALTWIIPAGKYKRQMDDLVGREIAVPGSYERVESNPQGIFDVLMAPVNGFYDISDYTANAIDVSLFVLIIGGFLGVVNQTGAIRSGLVRVVTAMRGNERWLIPILMALFAAGGTTYGMAEETLAFYALIIPIMIAVGYDALTAVAIIMLGAGVGVLGSTINPFATTIASNASGIAFTEGIALRLAILITGWLLCVLFVMRYAERVRKDPSQSLVASYRHEFEHDAQSESVDKSFDLRQKLVLLMFGATFLVMVVGVSSMGWWMGQMSALFIGASVLIGFVSWMGERQFVKSFVEGASDLLGVALTIGIARGIVVIMDAGNITDTILHAAEGTITNYSSFTFVAMVYWIEVAMSFLIPSTSGLAVVSMPILAPLADFAGVGRDLVVTAYQSASGVVNLVTPTSAVVIGGLAIGKVPYQTWIRFVWPLLLVLTLLALAALAIGVVL